MLVTVANILDLNVFQDATLLTNQASANRKIRSVSVSDVPLSEDILMDDILMEGDFFLSTLYYTEEDDRAFERTLRVLILAGSSGLCVTDEHLPIIPEDMIQLCNDASFPLIQIDKDVPYALIIREITESIIQSQSDMINVNIINRLLNGGVDSHEINRLTQRLNPNFKSCLQTYFIHDLAFQHQALFIDNLNANSSWFALPYLEGILVIVSFSEKKSSIRLQRFEKLSDYIIDHCQSYGDPIIGISGRHLSLTKLSESIREALFAANSAPYSSNRVLYYDNLGSIRLLIALRNHQELFNYHHLTIKKVISYDDKYNTSLMETLESFVKCDGDYKKTAAATNQHENTVRYQIKKIRKLLNLENQNLQFMETISLGIKAFNLLN